MEDDPPLFAALAVSRFVEDHTGWSIRKFVHTARRHRNGSPIRDARAAGEEAAAEGPPED